MPITPIRASSLPITSPLMRYVNKIKVVPMNAKKVNGEGNVQLHTFLTSALEGRQNSASRPGRFNPGPRTPLLVSQEVDQVPEPIWTILEQRIITHLCRESSQVTSGFKFSCDGNESTRRKVKNTKLLFVKFPLPSCYSLSLSLSPPLTGSDTPLSTCFQI